MRIPRPLVYRSWDYSLTFKNAVSVGWLRWALEEFGWRKMEEHIICYYNELSQNGCFCALGACSRTSKISLSSGFRTMWQKEKPGSASCLWAPPPPCPRYTLVGVPTQTHTVNKWVKEWPASVWLGDSQSDGWMLSEGPSPHMGRVVIGGPPVGASFSVNQNGSQSAKTFCKIWGLKSNWAFWGLGCEPERDRLGVVILYCSRHCAPQKGTGCQEVLLEMYSPLCHVIKPNYICLNPSSYNLCNSKSMR